MSGTSTMSIGGAGTGTVNGTLKIGPSALVSGNIFTLASAGNLEIGSTAGITASAATGNVQTGTRNYNTGANYAYTGAAAQVTGDGLPGTVNNLTVNNSGPTNVTLTNSVSVSGLLTLSSGDFVTGASTITQVGGSAGNTDVVGLVQRNTPGAAAAYGNPNNELAGLGRNASEPVEAEPRQERARGQVGRGDADLHRHADRRHRLTATSVCTTSTAS